jgi:cytochrome c-type biogenesis protein CcmH
MDFLVARYGEFILLKPRFNARTALLWGAPVGLLVVGGVVAFGVFRRRKSQASDAGALSHDEEVVLKEILSDKR